MSLLEFLGKIPGVQLNIANKTTNIITFSHGDALINGKKQEPEIKKKIIEEINTQKESPAYQCQIIHQDLLKDYEAYRKISLKEKGSLKILKDALSIKKFKMILMARRVKLSIEENSGKEEIDKSFRSLEKNYPREGRKVLNLISAKYFDDLILPMIDFFKERNPDCYREKFEEFFDSILTFFPIAVFVNNDTTERNIQIEIQKRLRLNKIPFIRIHTIGEYNILKVERAIKGIDFKGFQYNIEDSKYITSRGLHAQILTIRVLERTSKEI